MYFGFGHAEQLGCWNFSRIDCRNPRKPHPSAVGRRVLMKKPVLSIGNLLATAGVLFAGYVFLTALPDLRRYIRISTM